MKTKLIAYISLLSILSMGGAVTSCDDELPYSDRSATGNGLTVSEAKEFFEQQMMQIPVTRSSETGNKFLVPENFTPLWSSQTSTEYGNTACMNVPISTLSRYKARYKQNGKYEIVDVWQKLIILKNAESGDMVQFIMSVIPCYGYAKDNPGADIGKMFVQGGDKGDFSGMVLYSLPATGAVFQIATYINGHRTGSANSFNDNTLKDNMVAEAKRLSFCMIVPTRATEDFGWDFNGNAVEGAHWLPEITVDEFGGHYVDDGFSEWLGNGLNDSTDPPGSNPYGSDDTCDHCHDGSSCIGSGGTYASGDGNHGQQGFSMVKIKYDISKYPGYTSGQCKVIADKIVRQILGNSNADVGSPGTAIDLCLENANHTALEVTGDPEEIIDIIIKHLKAGCPIVVGVNHTLDLNRNNGTVDHFIVINGVGYDEDRQQLYFNYIETGRSKEMAQEAYKDTWRLYYYESGDQAKGIKPGMIYGSSYNKKKNYTISQIRPYI